MTDGLYRPHLLQRYVDEGKLSVTRFAPHDPRLAPPPDGGRAIIVPGMKPLLPFERWLPIDPAEIPRVAFVYTRFIARGYTSLTAAAPKAGKSLLALAEALDIASGRGFLSGRVQEPHRVLYLNLEDALGTLQARVAALCQTYDLDQSQLADTLSVVSAVDIPALFLVEGEAATVNEAAVAHLEAEIVRLQLDVVIFDPLQDLSRSPETNEAFRALGRELRRIAVAHNIAIHLIHHTRKPPPGGGSLTIDDARGGSALRGTCRFNRLLVSMTEEEGTKAGVDDFRHYVRIGDVESNLAPPSSARNRWFEKRSVQIGNGDDIAVIVPWTWPDAFASVTKDMAREVRRQLQEAKPPMRHDPRSERWAGRVVAQVCEFPLSPLDDSTTRKRKAQLASDLLRGWLESGVLQVADVLDEHRHAKKCVIAGPRGFDVGDEE